MTRPIFNPTPGDDMIRTNLAATVSYDLGEGDDVVDVAAIVPQVRLTFTSAEVGNGTGLDSGTMTNQDGGLAVRVQAEDMAGNLTGGVSRFDDEGIRFFARGDVTFDVRDLVSGVNRGDLFQIAQLGTSTRDIYDESGSGRAAYVNAGMGDDWVIGGGGNDFLVGGGGADRLEGGRGHDTFIGGSGDDRIFGNEGIDTAIINLSTDGADRIDLGTGMDRVLVSANPDTQVRVTFTSSEVGNDNANNSGTMTNQDGGLAVRLQTEDGSGVPTGSRVRTDDEGIRFVASTAGMTFDVRDLVSGTARGDAFQIVQLGTSRADMFDESATGRSVYVNGGQGSDVIIGSAMDDFLVGGAGRDRLEAGAGNDMLIGGADADTFVFAPGSGDDVILDFVSRTDRLDFTATGASRSDLMITQDGANLIVSLDGMGGQPDLRVTLMNVSDLALRDILI